ncbi:MAG: BspA family leucine-rich repeat surface protein, partial [Ileibacterium sp.]|nr:BspA family leucine-rich repeat surface protein [Ileibacterium sp.]
MFAYCKAMTAADLTILNTASVTDMSYMFHYAAQVKTINLSGLKSSKVHNMRNMFSNCSALTQVDMSGMDTSSVTNMYQMFNNCKVLKKIIVSESWNVENVSNSTNMFGFCSQLVGSNGTKYTNVFQDKTYARIDKKDEPGYLSAAVSASDESGEKEDLAETAEEDEKNPAENQAPEQPDNTPEKTVQKWIRFVVDANAAVDLKQYSSEFTPIEPDQNVEIWVGKMESLDISINGIWLGLSSIQYEYDPETGILKLHVSDLEDDQLFVQITSRDSYIEEVPEVFEEEIDPTWPEETFEELFVPDAVAEETVSEDLNEDVCETQQL